MGLGKYKGNEKCLRARRPQGRGRLQKMHAGKVFPGSWKGPLDTKGQRIIGG